MPHHAKSCGRVRTAVITEIARFTIEPLSQLSPDVPPVCCSNNSRSIRDNLLTLRYAGIRPQLRTERFTSAAGLPVERSRNQGWSKEGENTSLPQH